MNIIRRNNNSWLAEPFTNFFDDIFPTTPTVFTTNRTDKNVRVKEFETHSEISVAAPGISKEDFSIELQNGMLTVGYAQAGDDISYFTNDSFTRSWTVPAATTAKDITATHENGVLTVSVQKGKLKKEGTTIPIK